MNTYAQRSQRYQKKSPNYLLWIITILFALLLMCGGTYVVCKIVQEKQIQAQIDQATAILETQIQKEQEKNKLTTKKIKKDRAHTTSIIYLPEKGQKLPFEVSEQSFNKLITAEKQKFKDARQSVIVGKVANESLSKQLGAYTLRIDSYTWDEQKKIFVQQPEVLDQAMYYQTKTGEAVTGKQVVSSEANLLGIQQVIQQKILDQSKNPKKIIDSVLNLPRIHLDKHLIYHADTLEVQLPKNETGVNSISLPYEEIQGFIQTDLVDPRYLKEEARPLSDEKKYIALSFDDGPNPETTPELLNILDEKNVTATFFMLGKNAEAYPDVVKQVYDHDHIIGSHSYSHPQLNTLAPDELEQQIKQTDKAIFEACGILPRTLRPPYGAIDANTANVIGKPIIQWDIDSYDWESKNTDATIQQINQTVVPGGIILMHDIHPTTIAAVGTVIDNLRTSGYEIVTTEQILSNQTKPLYQYFGQGDAREI